jgi:hypothetical protein
MDAVLRFRSETFNYQHPIREDSNAGNQFYGEDVAEFLKTELSKSGFQCTVIDEDWGWLVIGKDGAHKIYDICIYNEDDEGDVGGRRKGTNIWNIAVLTFQPKKLLWLVTMRKKLAPDPEFVSRLESILSQKDCQFLDIEAD